MELIRFKTNINCGGCIAKIAPALNGEKEILKWDVDTSTPDRILTIETQNLKPREIMDLIHKSGFKAEPLN